MAPDRERTSSGPDENFWKTLDDTVKDPAGAERVITTLARLCREAGMSPERFDSIARDGYRTRRGAPEPVGQDSGSGSQR